MLMNLLIALILFVVVGAVLDFVGVPLAWVIALVVGAVVFFSGTNFNFNRR